MNYMATNIRVFSKQVSTLYIQLRRFHNRGLNVQHFGYMLTPLPVTEKATFRHFLCQRIVECGMKWHQSSQS
jgi:hypothetical protein